ncbi:hypothetical protein [Pedobacter nototheniae]|uniref:hypothetical protein n=1 Tax=Pedobacter nototheniae TaxID=2488994 RepID=UPI00292E4695|nr:hypothetical protein [Pedobacter nototheniae]
MNEFFDFFSKQQVDYPTLVFLMAFSCGIALFHTLIFTGLYDFNLRPKWIFFLINPLLVCLFFIKQPGYAFLALVILFASVFISAFIGMIYAGLKEGKKDKIDQEKFDTKYNIPKKSRLRRILGGIAAFTIIALGLWLASIEKLSLLLIIIPVIVVLDAIFFPSRKTNFYKLQAILPTSKMNAVAMGVVEVVGDLVLIEPLISPHFNEPCIGYSLLIEQESTDNDGKRSWRTIFTECKTNSFKIKDETGSVKVDGEGLEYYISKIDRQNESGSKRYSETYLKNDDYIFLIGYADSDDGETIIKKDDYHKVFGAAVPREVALRNKFSPLLTSFLTTLFFITLIIIYIILN